MGLPGENVQLIVRNKTPELKRKAWDRKADVGTTDIHLVIEAITMVKEKWAMDHSWELTLEKLLGEEKPAEEITRDSKEREENLEKEIMSKQEKYISEKHRDIKDHEELEEMSTKKKPTELVTWRLYMILSELFPSVIRTELSDVELRGEWELRLKSPEACNAGIYSVISFWVLNGVIFTPHF